MQCITIEGQNVEGLVLDIADLVSYLERLPDKRDRRGLVYELSQLVGMVMLARLSGVNKPVGIFEWLRHRQAAVVQAFGLRRNQTPCTNTLRTLLDELLEPNQLENELNQYLHTRYGGQNSQLVCIDGKTMRGTIPKGSSRGVHLLSAYLAEEGIVLKQVVVNDKENEISAAGALLEGLPLKNRVVCADAMQTQRDFCVDVLSRGADYLLWVKDNQPRLKADVQQFFAPVRRAPGWHAEPLPVTHATQLAHGHGRIERRTLSVIEDATGFIDWPGVCRVLRLQRDVTHADGTTSSETAFGITSCNAQRADPDQLLAWSRAYWQIENGLHYRRDVSLQEDATRTRFPSLAESIAVINNFLVAVTAILGFNSLPTARRYFDARIAAQLFSGFY